MRTEILINLLCYAYLLFQVEIHKYIKHTEKNENRMNRTHISGSNMCLILRQGVGEHGGELGLPVIVSNACPCHTLLLRRGVDCSDDTALPTSQQKKSETYYLKMNKFHNHKTIIFKIP
jgi:hypothetical protein